MVSLYVRTTGERLRLGVTTARRFGGAVLRNRAKRRVRAAVAGMAGRLRQSGEIVVVARPPILTEPFDAVVSELEALLAAAGVLAERGRRETGQ